MSHEDNPADNRHQLDQCIDEIKSLQQQLADADAALVASAASLKENIATITTLRERLAAAEDMIANAKDGYFRGTTGIRPGFKQTSSGWVAYWPANAALWDESPGTPTYFQDWYDAYLAAVAAGWLKPQPQAETAEVEK